MNEKLSIRHWRYSAIKQKIREAKALLDTLVTKEASNGYILVPFCKHNKPLFLLIEELCFFNYHCTNLTRKTIYLHQVVAYLHNGWIEYRAGRYCEKGVREVHHLDGDIKNNKPRNLIYVTPAENKLLAQFAGGSNSSTVHHIDVRPNFFQLLLATLKATYTRLNLSVNSVLGALTLYSNQIHLHISRLVDSNRILTQCLST